MGRRKKFKFVDPKMFSARIERTDYDKINEQLKSENATVQDFINETIRMYISGNFYFDNFELKLKDGEENE